MNDKTTAKKREEKKSWFVLCDVTELHLWIEHFLLSDAKQYPRGLEAAAAAVIPACEGMTCCHKAGERERERDDRSNPHCKLAV